MRPAKRRDLYGDDCADILYGAGTGVVKVPPLGPDYPDYCYNCGKSLKKAAIYGNGLCAKCYFDAEAEIPHPVYDGNCG